MHVLGVEVMEEGQMDLGRRGEFSGVQVFHVNKLGYIGTSHIGFLWVPTSYGIFVCPTDFLFPSLGSHFWKFPRGAARFLQSQSEMTLGDVQARHFCAVTGRGSPGMGGGQERGPKIL